MSSAPIADRTNRLHRSPPAPPVGELTLRLVGSEHHGRIVRIASAKCTVGSAPGSTLRLKTPGVHPLHCLILCGPNGTIVRRMAEDVKLNGQPIEDSPLKSGDRLQVGPIEFYVVEIPQPETPTAARAGGPAFSPQQRELVRRTRRQGHRRVRALLQALRGGKRQMEEMTLAAESRKLELEQISRQVIGLNRDLADQRNRMRSTEEQQRIAVQQVGQLTASLERLRTEILGVQAQRQNDADRWRLERSRLTDELTVRDGRLHEAELGLQQKEWEVEQLHLQIVRQERRIEAEHEQAVAARQRRDQDLEAAQLERSRLSEDLLESDRERQAAATELQQAKRDLEQLREQLKRSRQETADERTALRNERATQAAAAETWGVERSRLSDDLAARDRRIGELEKSLYEQRTLATRLQSDVESRRAELAELQKEHDEAGRNWQLERLQIIQQVGQAAAHDAGLIGETKRQAEELAAKYQAAEIQLAERLAEITRGETALAELREVSAKQVAEWNRERAEMQNLLRMRQEELAQQRARMEQTQTELQRTRSEVETLQANWAQERSELVRLHAEALSASSEVSQSQAELQEALAQVRSEFAQRQREWEQTREEWSVNLAESARRLTAAESAAKSQLAAVEQALERERDAKATLAAELDAAKRDAAEVRDVGMQTMVFTPAPVENPLTAEIIAKLAACEREEQELSARRQSLDEQQRQTEQLVEALEQRRQELELRQAELEQRDAELLARSEALFGREQHLSAETSRLSAGMNQLQEFETRLIRKQDELSELERSHAERIAAERVSPQPSLTTPASPNITVPISAIAAAVAAAPPVEEDEDRFLMPIEMTSESAASPSAPLNRGSATMSVDEFQAAADEEFSSASYYRPMSPTLAENLADLPETPLAEPELIAPYEVIPQVTPFEAADEEQLAEQAASTLPQDADVSAPPAEEPTAAESAMDRRLAAFVGKPAARVPITELPPEPAADPTPETTYLPPAMPEFTADALPQWNFEHESPERMDTISGLRMRNLLDEVKRLGPDHGDQEALIPDPPSRSTLQYLEQSPPAETPAAVDDVLSRLKAAGILKENSPPPPPVEKTPEEATLDDARNEFARRLGLSADFSKTESTPEPESMQPVPTIPNPFAASQPTPEPTGEEESIEAYMQQLLQRVRGDGPATSTGTNPVYKAAAAPQHSANPAPVAATPVNVKPDLPPVKPEEYIPRSAPAETSVNLAAMREIANTQARSAIQKHQKTVGKQQGGAKILGAALTVIVSAVLTYNGYNAGSKVAIIGAVLGFGISLYWLTQAIVLSSGWYRAAQKAVSDRAHRRPKN